MKKFILTLMFVFVAVRCLATPTVVIRNPVVNGVSMKAEIKMTGGTGSTTSVVIEPGEAVVIPDTLSIIEIKVVFDIDEDGKTGLQEAVDILKKLTGVE